MEEHQKPVEVKLKTTEIELPKFDASQFIGDKVKIDKVTEMEGQHGYFIKIETTPVTEILKDGVKKPVTASRIFGLQKDEEGNIGWGKDTYLGEYLTLKKVKHYNELVGKEVKIQVNVKDGKEFLTFA